MLTRNISNYYFLCFKLLVVLTFLDTYSLLLKSTKSRQKLGQPFLRSPTRPPPPPRVRPLAFPLARPTAPPLLHPIFPLGAAQGPICCRLRFFFTKPYRSAAIAVVHQPSPSSHRLRESPFRRPVPLNALQPIHSHRQLTLFLCLASLYTPLQPWLDRARRQARVRAFEVLTLLPPSSRLPNRDATPHVATPPPDRCVSA
jgi:hypothetical protein